ncbi:uncharacterized protein [Typha latifolia]|uniref:uncharacterized protein n=1 Tax=Typha latifolia TaxID=4733 RepID=UPI003C2DB5D9
MKDFASCFSDHAVRVSDVSCSGGSGRSSSSVLVDIKSRSIQSAVTCLYRTRLSSSNKDLLVRLDWSKGHLGPTLSVGVDDDPSLHQWEPNAMSCQQLRKKKGTRTFTSGNSNVALFWDISSARYGSGPEPIADFYVVVMVDAEFALLLGDTSDECTKKFDSATPAAKFSMVARNEQVLGHALYSTKSRFREDGREHEITISYNNNESELSVCVDRKRVVYVRRLMWNFRGNQTIFIDGSPVDMMWDVHDWWFSNSSGGCAVFMFRTRSALESRLWFEEEVLHKQQGVSGFSFLVQAFKTP